MPFHGNPEQRAQQKKDYAKRQRDYLKSLTPEQKEQRKREARWRKEDAIENKQQKALLRDHKAKLARAKAVLLYMKKTDVLYHHHSQSDSMMKDIIKALDSLKQPNRNTVQFRINGEYKDYPRHDEYNSYIWNYQGTGNNYLPICQFGCIWRGPFDTIYDTPLDGSYIFSIYDSGQRGLGSFNGITATPVEETVHIPKVSPGSLIPITAF